jgi:ABC-type proline/glycine betaine transport system ATPase subunit
MHYRNGREAKNGDTIVMLEGGKIVHVGVLHDAAPGNDYCNGYLAPVATHRSFACLVDCLSLEDVAALLKEHGLDKRPEGK